MDGLWGPFFGAVGIIVAALLTYFATRGKDKTGGVNAYIDQLQKDREDDRKEHRLQKEDWVAERARLIKEFAEEFAEMKAAFSEDKAQMKAAFAEDKAQMKAAFAAERNELRAELDAALADVRTLRQQIAAISVVRTIEPPPTKETP